MLSINTNQNKSRKIVEIDGHPFTVRKVGAGEELVLMQKMREYRKLEAKTKGGELPEADQEKFLQMSSELLAIMAACYDDGGDGSKAKELVNASTWQDLKDYHDYIFGESSASDTTEPAKEAEPAPANA